MRFIVKQVVLFADVNN